MIRRALFFFTKADEREASEALLQAFPGLKFVDGQHWPTANPPLAASIQQCKSNIVYLWPSTLVPNLSSKKLPTSQQRSDIRFQGAAAGPVIQFCRCRTRRGLLELGQASASVQDATSEVGKWQIKVVDFLKKKYRFGMDCYCSRTGTLLTRNLRQYLVGKSILENPCDSPRLVLALGRDEHLVPNLEPGSD